MTRMPGKHVSFVSETKCDSSLPALFSTSEGASPSLPSSPYHYLPSTIPGIPHSALVAGPVRLNYNVSLFPTPGVTLNHPLYNMSSLWDHPMTNPPMPFMEVECAAAGFPWKITISPSRKSTPYITFRDFFSSLYYNLRKRATQAEYEQVKSARLQRHIVNAYQRRYERLADCDQYEEERRGGLRRVDFLGEYVQFAGLSPNSNGRSKLTLEKTALKDDLEVMKLVPADGPPGSLSPTEDSAPGNPSISPEKSEAIVVEQDHEPSRIRPARTIDFICWPDSGKFGSALKSAGTLSQSLLHQRLPVIFEHGSGGCLIALVCDMDCQTWLEEHFDDDLLVKIRERGIGGPLPSVMGVNQPALVLFGASADSDVLHFAEVLANHSMYPVIVQPLSENVASNQQHFFKDISHSSEPVHNDSGGERREGGSGGRIQHGKGQGASNDGKRAWKGRDDLPDDDMGESGDRNGDDGNGKDRNENGVQDIDGFGNPHTTMITVEFKIGKANLQRLELERHMKFKQLDGNNRSLKSLERDCNVQVQLLVTPSGDGAEVKQCGSRTKLSFLAHATNPHVMNKVTYLRGPNDPAPQRLKNATSSAKTAEGGFDAGLSSKVTGKWGKTTTRTLEIQDSSDLPESGWLVRYFGAHSDKGEEIQSISLDAKFERIDFSGGRRSLQERLDVIYGMGVNLIGERPKIGFVAQDNIDIWIPMKSKAKHAGVMLMVLDYIADISKDTAPLILKDVCHSEDVLVDSSSSLQGREVGVALGVNLDPPAKIGKLDGLTKKVANFMGWQDTEEESPLSASDIRDMFPAALGWDWKNQEVVPSVWASVEDLEANGWKIIREAPPPPLPSKLL